MSGDSGDRSKTKKGFSGKRRKSARQGKLQSQNVLRGDHK